MGEDEFPCFNEQLGAECDWPDCDCDEYGYNDDEFMELPEMFERRSLEDLDAFSFGEE